MCCPYLEGLPRPQLTLCTETPVASHPGIDRRNNEQTQTSYIPSRWRAIKPNSYCYKSPFCIRSDPVNQSVCHHVRLASCAIGASELIACYSRAAAATAAATADAAAAARNCVIHDVNRHLFVTVGLHYAWGRWALCVAPSVLRRVLLQLHSRSSLLFAPAHKTSYLFTKANQRSPSSTKIRFHTHARLLCKYSFCPTALCPIALARIVKCRTENFL